MQHDEKTTQFAQKIIKPLQTVEVASDKKDAIFHHPAKQTTRLNDTHVVFRLPGAQAVSVLCIMPTEKFNEFVCDDKALSSLDELGSKYGLKAFNKNIFLLNHSAGVNPFRQVIKFVVLCDNRLAIVDEETPPRIHIFDVKDNEKFELLHQIDCAASPTVMKRLEPHVLAVSLPAIDKPETTIKVYDLSTIRKDTEDAERYTFPNDAVGFTDIFLGDHQRTLYCVAPRFDMKTYEVRARSMKTNLCARFSCVTSELDQRLPWSAGEMLDAKESVLVRFDRATGESARYDFHGDHAAVMLREQNVFCHAEAEVTFPFGEKWCTETFAMFSPHLLPDLIALIGEFLNIGSEKNKEGKLHFAFFGKSKAVSVQLQQSEYAVAFMPK